MNAITKPNKCRTKAKHRRGVWTEEMDAKLIRLREGGFTTVEIAPELGVTKNSVCGRINRLGLSKSEDNPIKPLTPEEKAAKVKDKHRRDSQRYKMREKKRKAAIKRLYLDEPTAKGDTGGCQFLHGEPTERNFCGHDRRKGSSYCDHHHSRCYISGSAMDEPRAKRGGANV